MMNKDIIYFDIEKNIWETNPFLSLFYYKLNKEDKSNNKNISSIYLWAIALQAAFNSPLKNFSNKEKEKIINDFIEEYSKKLKLKPFIFDSSLEEYKEDLELMRDLTTPIWQKMLKSWEDKLKERTDFLTNTLYSEDTRKMLDEMMGLTHKMWLEYYRIKKESESHVAEKGFGGEEESFLEMNG